LLIWVKKPPPSPSLSETARKTSVDREFNIVIRIAQESDRR
jgi:hypothetical protein